MEARRSFTLRFEHPETHDLLALVSGRLGVSMNQLAEQMIRPNWRLSVPVSRRI